MMTPSVSRALASDTELRAVCFAAAATGSTNCKRGGRKQTGSQRQPTCTFSTCNGLLSSSATASGTPPFVDAAGTSTSSFAVVAACDV